jgi:hypothetical protein
MAYKAWMAGWHHFQQGVKAETPENALCQLMIELLCQGSLFPLPDATRRVPHA